MSRLVALVTLFGAALACAEAVPPPFDVDRALKLIGNNYIQEGGWVQLVTSVSFENGEDGNPKLNVSAIPLFPVALHPGPLDADRRPERFDLEVEQDICRMMPEMPSSAKTLSVFVGGRFVHWRDALMPNLRKDGSQRYYIPPQYLKKEDLEKARACHNNNSAARPVFAQGNEISIAEWRTKPTPDIDRARRLVENNLAVVAGYLVLATKVDAAAGEDGKLSFTVDGKIVYSLEGHTVPGNSPEWPTLMELDVVNRDWCNAFEVKGIPIQELSVFHDGQFFASRDLLMTRWHPDGRVRYTSSPWLMKEADVKSARQCSKGPLHGGMAAPLRQLDVYSGESTRGWSLNTQLGSRGRNDHASCSSPMPLTRVKLTTAPEAKGEFTVNVRAISAMQCSWAGGEKILDREFTNGFSTPVEYEANGNEFTIEDFSPLWEAPAFPRYPPRELQAALGRPLEGANCAPVFRGHRVTVVYERKIVYEHDIRVPPTCRVPNASP